MPEEIKIKDLVKLLSNRNTIPIIGFEMLRLKKETGQNLSFLEFLGFEYMRKNDFSDDINSFKNSFAPDLDKLTAADKAEWENAVLDVEFYEELNDVPIYLIKQYLRKKFPYAKTGMEIIHSIYHCISSEKKDLYRSDISDLITDYRKSNSNLFATLRAPLAYLSKIKHFQFYINATFLHALQISLETFRLKKDDKLDVCEYSALGGCKEIKLKAQGIRPVNDKIDNVTIYNLLGTHDAKPPFYVLIEADFIQLILDLARNEKDKYNSLQELLKNAHLLFIGCNFKDWFLRFFLRIFTDQQVFAKSAPYQRFLVDYEEYISSDNNLVVFMDYYSIRTNKLPVEDFIKDLYKACKQYDPDSVEKDVYNHYIFISYCSDDKEIARKIRKQLELANCDSLLFSDAWGTNEPVEGGIWFDDNDLTAGQDIDGNIGKAIENCAVFIPIVSSTVGKKENADRYFWKEWDFGCKRNKDIFPVYIGNPDLNMLKDVITKVNIKEYILPKFSERGTKGVILSEEVLQSENPLPSSFIQSIKKAQFTSRLKNDQNGNQ